MNVRGGELSNPRRLLFGFSIVVVRISDLRRTHCELAPLIGLILAAQISNFRRSYVTRKQRKLFICAARIDKMSGANSQVGGNWKPQRRQSKIGDPQILRLKHSI